MNVCRKPLLRIRDPDIVLRMIMEDSDYKVNDEQSDGSYRLQEIYQEAK